MKRKGPMKSTFSADLQLVRQSGPRIVAAAKLNLRGRLSNDFG